MALKRIDDLTLAQKMPLAFANMAFSLRKMGRMSVRFMRLAQLGRGVFVICPQRFGNLSACYFVSAFGETIAARQ